MTSAYTSQVEVQTYMYGLLMPANALDSTLAGLGLNAVYDFMAVPQNAPFDYLTIGDGYEMSKNTLGPGGAKSDGFLYYPTLHIWSAQRGTANIGAMVARLNTLFLDRDTQPWTLPTLHHCYTMANRTNFLADPTGTIPILHAAIQYQVYTTQ